MNLYRPTLNCRCESPYADAREDPYHCLKCGHDIATRVNAAITAGRRQDACRTRTRISNPLPPGPFRHWIDGRIAHHGHERFLRTVGWTRGRASWIRNRAKHVDLSTVDEAVTREGSTSLAELYPGEDR